MKIGDFEIGSAPFIIAEAGLNHNGSEMAAIEMIAKAKQAGADCVKFQTFKAHEFCRPDDPLFEIFKRSEFDDNVWPRLKQACDDIGIMFLSTPQNRSDLDLLLPLGIPAIKVGSDDFCNRPLIEDYATEGLPLILSTGMATEREIGDVYLHMPVTQEVIYLLCTSQYPTPPEEARVARVRALAEYVYPSPVGFSDHTVGFDAAVMALGLGAVVFEKHFTLDHTLPGPDHAWALEPSELAAYVTAIRHAWVLKGSDSLALTPREAEQKRKYQRMAGQQLRGAA